MSKRVRLTLAIVAGIATPYLLLIPLSLLPLGSSGWVTGPLSLVCGIATGRFVWRQLGAADNSVVNFMLVGAFTVGGIGFVAGFFGPMIFAPDANQGPLLGLFITGPLGFVLGAVAGLVYGLSRRASQLRPGAAP